ncbi:signal peptidase I [Candidatus Thorarchaeota archaeon]|nr:MAG: signal peptidase I [Candidatus Thorarchaeota archaeon]
MERARSILKWDQRSEIAKTSFIILIVVGATLGSYGIFTLTMGTSTPLVVVESKSMIPNLDIGHLLILQNRAPDRIYLNDIIVFNTDYHNKPIVHRIVEIQNVSGELRYFTKGDNNSLRDQGYRVYEDIIGVVVLAIPYVGYVTLFLHEPYGLPIVLIIFIALLVLPEFFFKDDKKDDELKKQSEEDIPNI